MSGASEEDIVSYKANAVHEPEDFLDSVHD